MSGYKAAELFGFNLLVGHFNSGEPWHAMHTLTDTSSTHTVNAERNTKCHTTDGSAADEIRTLTQASHEELHMCDIKTKLK